MLIKMREETKTFDEAFIGEGVASVAITAAADWLLHVVVRGYPGAWAPAPLIQLVYM